MAINTPQSLVLLLCAIQRRRRLIALSRVAAVCAIFWFCVFLLVVWGDARWNFSPGLLALFDLLLVASGGWVLWNFRGSHRATRSGDFLIAIELERKLGLRNSELTNALELARGGSESEELRRRVIDAGDAVSRGLSVGAVAPLHPLRQDLRHILIAMIAVAAVAGYWPGPTCSAALRLVCPWSDEPAFVRFELNPTWQDESPRRVVVEVKSQDALATPRVADLVWVEREWWGGLGREIARTPLRFETGRFVGEFYEGATRGTSRREYYISTELGRTRVMTLPPLLQRVRDKPAQHSASTQESGVTADQAIIRIQREADLTDAIETLLEQAKRILSGRLTEKSLGALRIRAQRAAAQAGRVADLANALKQQDAAWSEVELQARALSQALAQEGDPAEGGGAGTQPATGESLAKARADRLSALRESAASLASLVSRLAQQQASREALPGGAPSAGSGAGVGSGSGAGELSGGSQAPGFASTRTESGGVTAASTQPDAGSGDASDLQSVSPKYREMAADYLRRVARDRAGAATRPR